MEKVLHNRFAGARLGGEWFSLSPSDVDYIRTLTPDAIRDLLKTGNAKGSRLPVPPGFEGRRTTAGTKQLGTEVDESLADAFRAYAHGRGETVRAALERAMRREMANPPQPVPDPPLPPVTVPPPAPKKPRRKKP